MQMRAETRNHTELDRKEEVYEGNDIVAYKLTWEEFNKEKDRWNKKSLIVCTLNKLNLGECDDGAPFTAVNQAVNVAKGLVNYRRERTLDRELNKLGYKNKDLFKYNSLKDLKRITEKQKLINNVKNN